MRFLSVTSRVLIGVSLIGSLMLQSAAGQQVSGAPQKGGAAPRPATSPPGETPGKTQAASDNETDQTLDRLLDAESYAVYGEVRMVGQFVRAGELLELIRPLQTLGSVPKELSSSIQFLTANAEALSTAQLMFAALPAKPDLPQGIFAIRFSSSEAARNFEPALRRYVAAIMPAPTSPPPGTARTTGRPQPAPQAQKQSSGPLVKRRGNLLLVSDSAFDLDKLKGDDNRPLAHEQRFQDVRTRFTSEPLFVYLDVDLFSKGMGIVAGAHTVVADNDSGHVGPPVSPPATETEAVQTAQGTNQGPGQEGAAAQPVLSEKIEEGRAGAQEGTKKTEGETADESAGTKDGVGGSPSAGTLVIIGSLMMGGLLNTPARWPEAVGLAAAFDGDAIVVRALALNPPGTRPGVIPFFPLLVPGQAAAPQSPLIMPADTEIFVSVSFDLPQIIETVLNGMTAAARNSDQDPKGETAEARIKALEKKLGFSIKNDLLPTLGSEVGACIPLQWFDTSYSNRKRAKARQAVTSPAVVISLRDKESLRALLPRLLEELGIPRQFMRSEKQGDIEIINLGELSLAFIDNFLVVSDEAASVRRVADAYANQQTLAQSQSFRNAVGWQPQQSLAQLYISKSLMESMLSETRRWLDPADVKTQETLAQLNITPAALTYNASPDAGGYLHELHLPKNLVKLLVASETLSSKRSPVLNNEIAAIRMLTMLDEAQEIYKAREGKGSYATLEQLKKRGYSFQNDHYRIELTASGDKYEATATPIHYGQSGRRSFFIDESGVIRAADHGGRPASAADKSIDQ